MPTSTRLTSKDSRQFRIQLAWNLTLIGLLKLKRQLIFIRYPPTQKELNHVASQSHRNHGYLANIETFLRFALCPETVLEFTDRTSIHHP
jgi:hypothetical protein